MPSPFFIVGVPRSGTTLLTVLLNNHSRLFLDKKAIAIRTLNFAQRVEAATKRNPGARPPVHWTLEASGDERLRSFLHWPLLDHNPDLSLREFIGQSFTHRAETHGKAVLGDKSPDAVERLPELMSLFPAAKIIVVVRDARPNVLSLVKRQYMSLRVAAQRWKDWNAAAAAALDWHGNDRILRVRYEDLLREPEATLKIVSTFLGVTYETAMLNLAGAEATQTAGAYVKKTFDTAAIDRWRTQMNPTEQAAVERICGSWLTDLGYDVDPDRAGNHNLSFWTDYRLRVANAFRLLFRPNRKLMQDQQLVEVRLPLTKRIYILLATIAGGLLRKDLLESLTGKSE